MLTRIRNSYQIHDAAGNLVEQRDGFANAAEAQRAGELAHREYIATLGVSLAAQFMTDDQITKELGI